MPPDSVSTLVSALSTSWANSSRSVARRRHSAREIPKYRPYTIRFSRTVNSSSRLSCCGTTPSRARMRTPSSSGSRPRMDNSPPVRGDTQAIIRIVDDLPAPFGPRNPNDSPRATSRSMPATASTSGPAFTGKLLRRSRATIIGPAGASAGGPGWSCGDRAEPDELHDVTPANVRPGNDSAAVISEGNAVRSAGREPESDGAAPFVAADATRPAAGSSLSWWGAPQGVRARERVIMEVVLPTTRGAARHSGSWDEGAAQRLMARDSNTPGTDYSPRERQRTARQPRQRKGTAR